MGRSPCSDNISGLKRGPWTPEEDDLLTSYIQKHGCRGWRSLPMAAGLNRCSKSCRLRWINYLRSDIKRGCFTDEEKDMIIKLHSVVGNKWSKIASHLPGRTDNEIKNYWNTHLRRKLLNMNIDPVTHKPRIDLNILANPSNLGALIIPNLDGLTLQPNLAQIVQLQVLQNMLQILNTYTSNISTLNIDQMIDKDYSCSVTAKTVPFNFDAISNTNALQDIIHPDNICPNQIGPSYVTIENYQSEPETLKTLDGSVLLSQEPHTIGRIESNSGSTNGPSDYTPVDDNFFDGFEKLLDDGNSDFWKDFII